MNNIGRSKKLVSTFCLLTLLSIFVVQCQKRSDSVRNYTDVDTVEVVQTILNDDRLVLDVLRSFEDQPMKLIAGPIIKTNQQFIFAGKSVQIVVVSGNYYQIHEKHRKELYVSVGGIEFFPKDSANVSLVFHAGNAIEDYRLKKCDRHWYIVGYEYGKF